MGNELVVVNYRDRATTLIVPDVLNREDLAAYQGRSGAGLVMVPGLNYRRRIENAVSDQFNRIADSFEDKRMLVHEHLLDMIGMLRKMIIEDIQAAAYRWARAEAKIRRYEDYANVATRDEAANEALTIIGDHFAILHDKITTFSLVDRTDPKQNLIILELVNLESCTSRYVCLLILGWE
jgi:hypothetical protein